MATQKRKLRIFLHELPARWLAGLALSLLVILPACQAGSNEPLQPGEAAPDFSLESACGGKVSLQDTPGQSVLLAFLDTLAEAGQTADPSRSQVVSLKSMQEQYGPQGLVVLILDASHLQTGKEPGGNALLNSTYNWQLDAIPVLMDPGGRVACLYSVTGLPTTFLVASDGTVQDRWDGLATLSQLAFAVQAALGIPIF